MENSKDLAAIRAEIDELRAFIFKKMQEADLKREKEEQKTTIHEVELALKGKELILDNNMCY